MKVTNSVHVYEVDGSTTQVGYEEVLKVLSHWNHTDRVVLEFEGRKITVLSRDLVMAIRNAENH